MRTRFSPTRSIRLLSALLLSAALFAPTTRASFCGKSGVPYSFEVLPSGAPVLGCAQPSCVAAAPDENATTDTTIVEDSEFLMDVNGQADGFFRDGDRVAKRYRHKSAPRLIANCSGGFNELSCPRKNQWVGGIEYIDHPRQPLILQCCTFDGLRFSQEVGSTIVGPGEAITGGEVIRNGRQISFDVIADVRKIVRSGGGSSGQSKVSYEVTVRRMNCLPDPPEPEVQFDEDVPAEVFKVLSSASNRDLGTAEKLEKKNAALKGRKKAKQQAAPNEQLPEIANVTNAEAASASSQSLQQPQQPIEQQPQPQAPPPPQQQQQQQQQRQLFQQSQFSNSEASIAGAQPQQPQQQQQQLQQQQQFQQQQAQFQQQQQPQQQLARQPQQQQLPEPQPQQPDASAAASGSSSAFITATPSPFPTAFTFPTHTFPPAFTFPTHTFPTFPTHTFPAFFGVTPPAAPSASGSQSFGGPSPAFGGSGSASPSATFGLGGGSFSSASGASPLAFAAPSASVGGGSQPLAPLPTLPPLFGPTAGSPFGGGGFSPLPLFGTAAPPPQPLPASSSVNEGVGAGGSVDAAPQQLQAPQFGAQPQQPDQSIQFQQQQPSLSVQSSAAQPTLPSLVQPPSAPAIDAQLRVGASATGIVPPDASASASGAGGSFPAPAAPAAATPSPFASMFAGMLPPPGPTGPPVMGTILGQLQGQVHPIMAPGLGIIGYGNAKK